MAFEKESTTNFRLNELLANSKNKSYFVIVITVLFVIAIFFFGIRPAVTAVINQNTDNKTRQEVIDKMETKLEILKNLTTESQTKAELLEFFNNIFPDEPTQDFIINDISDIADAHDLFVSSIGFAEVPRTVNIQREYGVSLNVQGETVNVTIEGPQAAILNMIEDLEESKRIYNLTSITISRKPEEELFDGTGRDFRLSLTMYYFYWQDVLTPLDVVGSEL